MSPRDRGAPDALVPDRVVSGRPEDAHTIPTHVLSSPAVDVKGMTAGFGRARLYTVMLMILSLALGAYVFINNRLYQISFKFGRDGRITVTRSHTSPVMLPSSSPSFSPNTYSSPLFSSSSTFIATSKKDPNLALLEQRLATLEKRITSLQKEQLELKRMPPSPRPTPVTVSAQKSAVPEKPIPGSAVSKRAKPVRRSAIPTPQRKPVSRATQSSASIRTPKATSKSRLRSPGLFARIRRQTRPSKGLARKKEPLAAAIESKKKERGKGLSRSIRLRKRSAEERAALKEARAIRMAIRKAKSQGIFRRIRLRRRTGEERAALKAHKSEVMVQDKEIKKTTEGGLFRRIRLRERVGEERAAVKPRKVEVIVQDREVAKTVGGLFRRIRLRKRVGEERAAVKPRKVEVIVQDREVAKTVGGFFRRIRLRRRSGEERATVKANKALIVSKDKEVAKAKGGLFRRIRLRHRSADERHAIKAEKAMVKQKKEPAPSSRKSPSSFLGGIKARRAGAPPVEVEPEVTVLEIRLRTKRRKKSEAPRGLVMRQPSIQKKRKEEARKAEEEKKRIEKEAKKEKKEAAKLEAQQKREAAERLAREEREAKKIETSSKREKKRTETQFVTSKQEAKLKSTSKTSRVDKDESSPRFFRPIRIRQRGGYRRTKVGASKPAKKFFRKIRLRRRSGIKKVVMEEKKAATVAAKSTRRFFRAIRMRRRSAAERAATKTKKRAADKARQNKDVFRAIRIKRRPKASESDNALLRLKEEGNVKPLPYTARKPLPQTRSSSSSFFRRKRSRASRVRPLVDKNAPEEVLPKLIEHFVSGEALEGFGRMRPRSIRQMIQPQKSVRANRGAKLSPEKITKTMTTEASPPKYITIRVREPQKTGNPSFPAIRVRRTKRK